MTNPPSAELIPPNDLAQPTGADVEHRDAEERDRGDQAELADQRQPAVALDRPMDGQPRGRCGARGRDLDRRGAAARRRPGTDVRLPRVAPSRHRHGLSHGPIRSGPAIGVVPLGAVRCTLAGSRARRRRRARALRGRERAGSRSTDPAAPAPPDRPADRPSAWVRSPVSRRRRSSRGPSRLRPAPTNGAGRAPARRRRDPPLPVGFGLPEPAPQRLPALLHDRAPGARSRSRRRTCSRH